MRNLAKVSSSLPAHADAVLLALVKGRDALIVARQQHNIPLAKHVHDQADAFERWSRRQNLGEDWIGLGHKIKIEALAVIGELLAAMPKQAGGRGRTGGGRNRGSKKELQFDAPPTLADVFGIEPRKAKKLASIAQQLAGMDAETREAIAQREDTLAQARRRQKSAAIRKAVSLPDAKYRVLYADPPWSYNDKADAGAVQSGGAELHYPSMTIPELCALPIRDLCEPNAVLFLWVTSPLLFECQPVFKAWGFEYRASFVWFKVKHNMGHYNSVRHEFLLICTMGSCTPDVVTLFDSVQVIERTTHSTKPHEFRTIIETLYPHGKRLELFARGVAAKGWDAWGYEAP